MNYFVMSRDLPANVLLIGLNYQILKQLDSENKHIRL